jgi:ABC-type bacteriocin/lantibiotic exporter with double-glycine peptidase domain
LNILNNPYFNALRNISEILDEDQKKRSLLMWGLLMINAVFDVVGLAAIYPLMNAALNPKLIYENVYLKGIYDFIGVKDTITFLFILSAILFLIFLIKNIVSILIFYIQARFSFNISKRLSQKVFQYYYDQGYLYIANQDSGKKNYDILIIPYYFGSTYLVETLIMSTEIVVLLFIFLGLLIYNPTAVIFLMVFIFPIFGLVYLLTKNKTKGIGDERNETYPKVTSTILDSMQAYNDVQLSNKQHYFFKYFTALVEKINRLDSLQIGIYSKIHQRLNDIVLGLSLLIIFGFAYFFKENAVQILSLLTVFGIAAYRVLPAVNRIMGSTLAIKNVSYLIKELKPLANYKLQEYKDVTSLKLEKEIRFDKVGFKYPENEKEVLLDVSFHIQKGETIGFIGSSGSGKTTLLHIFLRFLPETRGCVTIDGVKLDASNNAQFQKAIGYVQQNVFIRNGTLRENIAFGLENSEINDIQLHKAIHDAMLAEFVAQHPDGMDMILGENGVKLSGGQRQRVGIARALYKDAQILLFDEATSALDHETEKAIVATINHLAKLDKTIVIVAHRITTLEMCDRIYELKNGMITGTYDYNEILKKAIHPISE